MDPEIVFDSENTFEVGPRSKIAISSRSNRKRAKQRVLYQCTDMEERDKEWQHPSTYNDSNELLSHNPAASHRKSLHSRSVGMDVKDSRVLKRGSMYQSSEEVRRMQEVRDMSNEKQDLSDDAFLSFEVIKSSPRGSSKESVYCPQPTKEALVSLNLDPDSQSLGDNKLIPRENMEFLDLSFRDLLQDRPKISISCSNADPAGNSSAGKEVPDFVEKVQVKETESGRLQLFSAGVDASIIYERDSICILPKSFSAKVGTPNTPYHSEREFLKSGRKTRFSPFKKMLDPILKSNTWRNTLLLEPETSSNTVSDAPSLSRHKFFPRSLLNDFSRATQKIENERVSNESDQVIKTAISPTNLHAVLRWEGDHGAPLYEFSVKDPEYVLFAKTWKAENDFNWVYTFHCCEKKGNSHNNRTKNRHDQQSPMIGQMQVSCYLCPEITAAGSFDNSAVTEFNLYDIDHARKKNAAERSHSPSNSFPWEPTELQPNLEIAAIVVQVPFSKKDALRIIQVGDQYKSGHKGFSRVSAADQPRVTVGNNPSPAYMKVVAPSGRHGLANSEEVGPSSLLDRWRFGGGCDCGGWDMGCPILVFETVINDTAASITGTQVTQQPIHLLLMGKKEEVPALSLTANGKGHYAVDFHAQLSALQAFSICIAILHCCEASSAVGHDKDRHKPFSNSLNLLLEDEVRDIIEAVAEEKKRKTDDGVKQAPPPSFFLDSPFSPMGRV